MRSSHSPLSCTRLREPETTGSGCLANTGTAPRTAEAPRVLRKLRRLIISPCLQEGFLEIAWSGACFDLRISALGIVIAGHAPVELFSEFLPKNAGGIGMPRNHHCGWEPLFCSSCGVA